MSTTEERDEHDVDVDADPGTPSVGDRVTLIDDHGQLHEAVCSQVHGKHTINAVYNASRSDGVFEQAAYDDRFDVATSLTPAEALDDPHSYIEGGWSA